MLNYVIWSAVEKGNDIQGFKGLWKKVKPFDKPEEVRVDVACEEQMLIYL